MHERDTWEGYWPWGLIGGNGRSRKEAQLDKNAPHSTSVDSPSRSMLGLLDRESETDGSAPRAESYLDMYPCIR